MLDSYTLINVDHKLHPALFDFLNEVLPFAYDKKVFDWEYDHDKKVFCYIENEEGEVVGVQGMIPFELHVGDQLMLSAKSETSYLAQSTQGKGLFKKLYQKTLDDAHTNGINHVWGFTSLGPVWKKLGFEVQNTSLFQYHIQMRKRNFFGTSGDPNKNIIKELAKYLLAFQKQLKTNLQLKRELKKSQADFSPFVLRDSLQKEQDLLDLYTALRERYPNLIHLKMNTYFLKKRIDLNPFVHYTKRFLYNKAGLLLGYFILALKDGIDSAFISDLTVIDQKHKAGLLALALKEIRQHPEIKSVKLFGNYLNEEIMHTMNCLAIYGHSSYDTQMYIVSKTLGEVDHCANFSDWYINGLWTEGISQ